MTTPNGQAKAVIEKSCGIIAFKGLHFFLVRSVEGRREGRKEGVREERGREEEKEEKPVKITVMVFELMLCSPINVRTFHAPCT